MSLFSVTRYEDNKHSSCSEASLLKSLRKKVREKNTSLRNTTKGNSLQDAVKNDKKRRLEEFENLQHTTDSSNVKTKKRKIDHIDDESQRDNSHGTSTDVPQSESLNLELDSSIENEEQIVEDSQKEEVFDVLGHTSEIEVKKVHRVLPSWLAFPSVVESNLCNTTPLSSLQLDNFLLQKLRNNGINSFFPVQAQVIPHVLQCSTLGFLRGPAGYRPSDVCCSAPTGSGKTLAYVLPIIQILKEAVTCHIRALILLPVQDLALQVYNVFQSYSKELKLKVGCVAGNTSLLEERNILIKRTSLGFKSNIDILVATPGRLVDHIQNTAGFSLKHLRFLVIDEADRMMEEIKQEWLLQVESSVNRPMDRLSCKNSGTNIIPLQKLLFSATLSQNPEKLQQLKLFRPKLFTSVVTHQGQEFITPSVNMKEHQQGEFIGKFTTPFGLKEQFYEVEVSKKPLAMLYFLKKLQYRQILCFTNSVETTHRLFSLLKLCGGVQVAEFSSNLSNKRRNNILEKFREKKIDILICSDAMARGVDIENVQYVISYECPPYLKTYVHRAGRTARAGRQGTAITLLETKEIHHFKKMMKEGGKQQPKEKKFKTFAFKPYLKPLQKALTELPDLLKQDNLQNN